MQSGQNYSKCDVVYSLYIHVNEVNATGIVGYNEKYDCIQLPVDCHNLLIAAHLIISRSIVTVRANEGQAVAAISTVRRGE